MTILKYTQLFILFLLTTVSSQDQSIINLDCKSDIDSVIQKYLNEKMQVIQEKEYGGGDVYGKFITSKVDHKNILITLDNIDKGEYGFTNKIYIFKNDSLYFVKYNVKEWDLTKDGSKYLMEESIYDFSKAVVLKYTRKKQTLDYYDETIKSSYVCKVVKKTEDLKEEEIKKHHKLQSVENYHDN